MSSLEVKRTTITHPTHRSSTTQPTLSGPVPPPKPRRTLRSSVAWYGDDGDALTENTASGCGTDTTAADAADSSAGEAETTDTDGAADAATDDGALPASAAPATAVRPVTSACRRPTRSTPAIGGGTPPPAAAASAALPGGATSGPAAARAASASPAVMTSRQRRSWRRPRDRHVDAADDDADASRCESGRVAPTGGAVGRPTKDANAAAMVAVRVTTSSTLPPQLLPANANASVDEVPLCYARPACSSLRHDEDNSAAATHEPDIGARRDA